MTAEVEHSTHHRHLEQARAQIVELLERQAVERDLVERTSGERTEVVSELTQRQQQAALAQRLARLHPADVAYVLESLNPKLREAAWALVRPEARGAVLLEISNPARRTLLTDMPPQAIALALRTLESDDIADVLGSLPEPLAQSVLAQLDRDDQAEVRSVLSFPEDTVGAEMDLDFIGVREDAALEAVLRLLRRYRKLPEQTDRLFVTDRQGELRGTLEIEQLLLSAPTLQVSELMQRNPVFFYTDDAIREAVDAFERYDLVTAPVVNRHKQVVGRLTVDAVVDAIQERQERESLLQVGLSEDDLEAPIWRSGRARWPWLALNLLTAFAASRVIGLYEQVIEHLVALATLMPIVASIGGNTGNQTMALVIRALAQEAIDVGMMGRLLVRELAIAALNGAVWGTVLGALTFLLYQDLPLSAVIAAATLLELLLAAAAGALIPLGLHRLGRDPVMGSSVLLTAMTDSGGFFIFLGLASLVLAH